MHAAVHCSLPTRGGPVQRRSQDFYGAGVGVGNAIQ